jgi:predicted DsbA family dithiol-disulfide isomerase
MGENNAAAGIRSKLGAALRNDGARAARLDITGVPFVVFAEKHAVFGRSQLRYSPRPWRRAEK